MNADRTTAITGIGPVCALGLGQTDFVAALLSGRTGISEMTLYEPPLGGGEMAAEIPPFEVNDYLAGKKSYLDRSSEIALAAVSLALSDAGITRELLPSYDAGLILGTAWGSLETAQIFFADFLAKGPRLVKPILFPNTYSNTAISLVAIEYGLSGYHLNLASGFVSSALALAAGHDLIRCGRAEMVIVGGFEALSDALLAGYSSQARMAIGTTAGSPLSMPFALERNGFIPGEAACVLVLEELEHARRRGAAVRAIVGGVGMAADAAVDKESGCGAGVQEAMLGACREAGVPVAQIDCVSAAANGSFWQDRSEALGIMAFLGRHATVPVTALKSVLGESAGAAPAMQVAAAVAMLENEVVPRIHSLDEPMTVPRLNLVMGDDLPAELECVMVNGIDSGGQCASILLCRA